MEQKPRTRTRHKVGDYRQSNALQERCEVLRIVHSRKDTNHEKHTEPTIPQQTHRDHTEM